MTGRTVNLMPWREQRQKNCRRFWILFLTLASLTMILATAGWRVRALLDRHLSSTRLQSDTQVFTRISSREPQFRALREQWVQQQSLARQREITAVWQVRLNSLANGMPDRAWLTTLHFRQGGLELTGLTRSFSALSALEQVLSSTQGFRLHQSGATERDEQGYWQFRYQLDEVDNNASRP
ncbi:PilN domain-containing protein [Phytobacter sp. V91]|uniref:PilN domain-containing protein n=1 Tax=Phytobacter sp. V91 TaxID=3369425 RepID=UPI003F5F86F7